MGLIACDSCGVVYAKAHLIFPPQYNVDDESFSIDDYEWDGDKFVPIIKCKLCGSRIMKEDND